MINRLFLTCLLAIIYIQCLSQEYMGAWVNVKATRIDGSKIIERIKHEGSFEYLLSGKNITMVDSSDFSAWSNPGALKMIDSKRATCFAGDIEVFSDSILVITHKHTEHELDKKNRFILIRREAYIKYLYEQNLIQFENDSTIIANNFLFPHYIRTRLFETFPSYLFDNIHPNAGAVTGYFILSKNGSISTVVITENRGFVRSDGLIRLIKKSGKKWGVPMEGYSYKVPFTIALSSSGQSLDVSFKMNDFVRSAKNQGLGIDEIKEAFSLFNSGNALVEAGEYRSSITEFTRCIEIDPLFIDAFYNRAMAYYKLDLKSKACLDWKYLKELEQTNGTVLYEQHCKEN